MKSKLFVVGASVLVCSGLWMGCSSGSSVDNGTADGGPSGSEAGASETGTTEG